MIVKQIPVGPMANFVYVVMEEASKEAMVVDSGWETSPIVRAVGESGAKVKYVVATHGHFDHVSTLRDLGNTLGAKVVAHRRSTVDCDIKVDAGDALDLGKTKVQVIYTPGHTDDSICLFDGNDVFTGDTLFVGTVGRFERQDLQTIYESLHDAILVLPPETMMYPGHDYGDVTHRSLSEEKKRNPYLQPRDFTGFASLFG